MCYPVLMHVRNSSRIKLTATEKRWNDVLLGHGVRRRIAVINKQVTKET